MIRGKDKRVMKMIDLKIILAVAVIIEIITITARFVLNLRAKKFYEPFMKRFNLKKMYHIHHLFVGLLIGLVFYEYPTLFNLGLGVALSDIAHHFIVLWALVGNPEFKLVYKSVKDFQEHKKKEKIKIKTAFKDLVQDINFQNNGPLNLLKQAPHFKHTKRYLNLLDQL